MCNYMYLVQLCAYNSDRLARRPCCGPPVRLHRRGSPAERETPLAGRPHNRRACTRIGPAAERKRHQKNYTYFCHTHFEIFIYVDRQRSERTMKFAGFAGPAASEWSEINEIRWFRWSCYIRMIKNQWNSLVSLVLLHQNDHKTMKFAGFAGPATSEWP